MEGDKKPVESDSKTEEKQPLPSEESKISKK